VVLDARDSVLATKSASAQISVKPPLNVSFLNVFLDKTETDVNSLLKSVLMVTPVPLTLATLLLDVSSPPLLAMITTNVLMIHVSQLLDADSFPRIVLNLILVSLMDVHLEMEHKMDVPKPQLTVIDVLSTTLLAPRLTVRVTSVNQLLVSVLLLTRTVTITTSAPMMDVILTTINAPTPQSAVMMETPVPLILATQLQDVNTPQLISPLVTINQFVPLILATQPRDVSTHQLLALLHLFARLLLVTLSWDVKKLTKIVDLS
jgi:hypothetical protein